ncbi:MAG: Spy/CpxP family protein refolding chaperone [Thermodesulfobacteriota bacterium]
MKKKLIVATLAICIMTVGSLTANAYQGNRGGYGQPGMSGSEYCENEWRGNHRKQNRHERVTELLGLSDEQQEKIKAIREEERSANQALRENMREYQEQMRQLTDEATFDENAIRTIAEKKAEIQVEMAVSRARMRSQIHEIMSPEQQELAKEFRSERQNKQGKHRSGHGGW